MTRLWRAADSCPFCAVPVGLAIGVIWTAADIAGPSLRGTVPAVAQVAMIRQRLLWGGAA